jgi:hypothetical protein
MRAISLGAIFLSIILVSVRTARADDVEQVEKATKLERDADTWRGILCFAKARAVLAEAEKEVKDVDETAKADVLKRIRDTRDAIARDEQGWNADRCKARIEQAISEAETDGDKDADAFESEMGRAEAILNDAWTKAHLDAAVRSELDKKIAWTRKKVASQAGKADARVSGQRLDRILLEVENAVQSAASGGGDGARATFDEKMKEAEDVLATKQSVLGADAAKFRERIAKLKSDFADAAASALFDEVEKRTKNIETYLAAEKSMYSETDVENWFQHAREYLEKCPRGAARTRAFEEKIAALRTQFDARRARGDRDEVVQPALSYWTALHEQRMRDAEGWEQETTPPKLAVFLHESPPKLGCDKTQHLLRDVVALWLDDSKTKTAQARFANDAEWKKTYGEAVALRDKAAGKVIGFATALLDEADKLKPGAERDELKTRFFNLKSDLKRGTEGAPGSVEILERIDGLDKRWAVEQENAAGAQAALVEKLTRAANEVWPDLVAGFQAKVRKIDASDAFRNSGAWQGSVVHISGGHHGVNINRAGADWWDSHDFIVEFDGIPVCGNLDAGLSEAVKEVEKRTGVEQDTCEECYAIVDGTCQAWRRVQDPLDSNHWIRGRYPIDGVRMRIVAWKACTIAAAVGKGTNLAKLSEFKDVAVSERGHSEHASSGGESTANGSSSSGSPGGLAHALHRLLAWAMCLVLGLAGALAAAHGASKFVPQVREQTGKLGDALGYAGCVFVAIAVLWAGASVVLSFVGWCAFGSLPAGALLLGGVATALDLGRSKGKITAETASLIQPAGIVAGIACWGAALVHLFAWDIALL